MKFRIPFKNKVVHTGVTKTANHVCPRCLIQFKYNDKLAGLTAEPHETPTWFHIKCYEEFKAANTEALKSTLLAGMR